MTSPSIYESLAGVAAPLSLEIHSLSSSSGKLAFDLVTPPFFDGARRRKACYDKVRNMSMRYNSMRGASALPRDESL